MNPDSRLLDLWTTNASHHDFSNESKSIFKSVYWETCHNWRHGDRDDSAATQARKAGGNRQRPVPFTLLILSVCLAAFIVALDRTIVATAIPRITDDSQSPADVGWYGSAYLLTSCAFQPIYGRVYAHFDVRNAYLLCVWFL